jgi:hypothetical protein
MGHSWGYGSALLDTAEDLILHMGHSWYLVLHTGTQLTIWFCTMWHSWGSGSALWVTDLVLHYGTQLRIRFCTMGHSW